MPRPPMSEPVTVEPRLPWPRACDLPGVRPGTQKRSKELVDRLFATAFELLRERDFDELTIDEMCAKAGATVGSFYARFDNKSAFVVALQHLVFERTMRSLSADRAAGRVPLADLETFVAWLCHGTVVWFQRYEGFIRASSKRGSVDPSAWEPLRSLGVEKADWCLPLFRQLVGTQAGHGFELSVRSSLQVLHGTLNNIVLVDPGPLRLHDAGTPRFLSCVVLSSVRGGLKPPRVAADRKARTAKPRRT